MMGCPPSSLHPVENISSAGVRLSCRRARASCRSRRSPGRPAIDVALNSQPRPSNQRRSATGDRSASIAPPINSARLARALLDRFGRSDRSPARYPLPALTSPCRRGIEHGLQEPMQEFAICGSLLHLQRIEAGCHTRLEHLIVAADGSDRRSAPRSLSKKTARGPGEMRNAWASRKVSATVLPEPVGPSPESGRCRADGS